MKKKYYIAWNEERTEGFITDNEADARFAIGEPIAMAAYPHLGEVFLETYEDQKKNLQSIEIETRE